jgi:hypothetical protein
MKSQIATVGAMVLILGVARIAGAVELIDNGSFESGSLAGWNVANQPGSQGSWYIQSGTSSQYGTSVPSPPDGTYAAMTDSTGPSSTALYQDFTVPQGTILSATLNYQRVRLSAGSYATPTSWDYTVSPNQHTEADILLPTTNALSTSVLTQLGGNSGDRYPYSPAQVAGASAPGFDLTSLLQNYAGQTLRLRFAEVNNQGPLVFGVDAVSLQTVVKPNYTFQTVISQGATVGGLTLTDLGRVAINNVGGMAVSGNYTDGQGNTQTAIVSLPSRTVAVNPPQQVGPAAVSSVINPSVQVATGTASGTISLNDAGQIGFTGTFNDASHGVNPNAGVFLTGSDNPRIRLGANVGGQPLDTITSVSLDKSGNAYVAAGSLGVVEATSSLKASLIPGDGSVSVGGLPIYSVTNVGVSASGLLAFVAYTSSGQGVFEYNPSTEAYKLLAQTGGTVYDEHGNTLTLSGFGGAVINNAGSVIYRGTFFDANNDSQTGFFTGDGAMIVETGDMIGNEVLSNLSSISYNDAGQIAFKASYADNSAAIVEGSVATVPEPSALMLVAAGAVTLLASRRWRKAMQWTKRV